MVNGMRFRPVFAGRPVVQFAPAASVSRMIDQFFDDSLSAVAHAPALPLDISEDEQHLYVRAALPGFSTEQVQAEIKEGVLTISAERAPGAEGEQRWHRRERRVDSLRRQVALPFPVLEDRVTAELLNGELTLTLPKVPKPVPTRIAIGGTGGAPAAGVPAPHAASAPAPEAQGGGCGSGCGCS